MSTAVHPVDGKSHPLQLAGTINHERQVLAHGQGHALIGAKIGKLAACVLLGNQHPVEPGEPLGVHLSFKLTADLLFGLAA